MVLKIFRVCVVPFLAFMLTLSIPHSLMAQGFQVKPESKQEPKSTPNPLSSKEKTDKKTEKESGKKTDKKSERPSEVHKPSRGFLPHWPVSKFDWQFRPISGYQSRNNSAGGVKILSTQSELGLGLAFANIPIPGGNPGMTMGVHASLSWGGVSVTQYSDQTVSSKDSSFERRSGGIEGDIYWRWLKWRWMVSSGAINYDDDTLTGYVDTKSLTITSEPGIILTPSWFLFATMTYLQFWGLDYDHPELKQNGIYLHTRKNFGLLNAYLDAGPGFSKTSQKLTTPALSPAEGQNAAISYNDGQSTYLLATAGSRLFWKITADARLKYILSAKNVDDRYAGMIEPSQDITNPSGLDAMPDDTLEYNAALRITDIWGGLGLTYQYHRLIYNLSRDDASRREISDSGWSVTFDLRF